MAPDTIDQSQHERGIDDGEMPRQRTQERQARRIVRHGRIELRRTGLDEPRQGLPARVRPRRSPRVEPPLEGRRVLRHGQLERGEQLLRRAWLVVLQPDEQPSAVEVGVAGLACGDRVVVAGEGGIEKGIESNRREARDAVRQHPVDRLDLAVHVRRGAIVELLELVELEPCDPALAGVEDAFARQEGLAGGDPSAPLADGDEVVVEVPVRYPAAGEVQVAVDVGIEAAQHPALVASVPEVVRQRRPSIVDADVSQVGVGHQVLFGVEARLRRLGTSVQRAEESGFARVAALGPAMPLVVLAQRDVASKSPHIAIVRPGEDRIETAGPAAETKPRNQGTQHVRAPDHSQHVGRENATLRPSP